MKKLVILLLSIFSVVGAADEDSDLENPPVQMRLHPPLELQRPVQNLEAIAPRPRQPVLDPNARCWTKCEFYYWMITACCLRLMGGGPTHTIHMLAGLANIAAGAAISGMHLNPSDLKALGIVAGVAPIVMLISKILSDDALKGSIRRLQSAIDVAGNGYIAQSRPLVLKEPEPEVEPELDPNAPCWTTCEYYYWTFTSCTLRMMGGGPSHTIHTLGALLAAAVGGVIAAVPLDATSLLVLGLISFITPIIMLLAKDTGESAMQGAERRKQYARDTAEFGYIIPDDFGNMYKSGAE